MGLSKIAKKTEDLYTEAQKVNGLQAAISEAILRGDFAAETYEWAFVVLWGLSHELKDGMQELMEDVYKAIKNEKEVGK